MTRPMFAASFMAAPSDTISQASAFLTKAQAAFQQGGQWPRNQGSQAIVNWARQYMVPAGENAATAARVAASVPQTTFQDQQDQFSASQAAQQIDYRSTIAQNDADANQIYALATQAIQLAQACLSRAKQRSLTISPIQIKIAPKPGQFSTTYNRGYKPANGGVLQGPKALGAATATTAADVANQVGVLTAVFANVTAGNALTPSQVTAANAAVAALQGDVNQLGGTPDPSAVSNAGGVSKGMAIGVAAAGLVVGFAVAKLMR